MATLFEWKAPPPKKGSVETVKFGNLEKIQKKLVGSSEAVIEEFENLFQQSSDLFVECNKFSQKDSSEPFSELETEAVELAKKKDEVETIIHGLYEKYKDQGLPRHDPKAIILKRESKLIIERVQRSIDSCRPLVNEVRQKRREDHSQKSTELEKIVDFGDDINNPFDEE